MKTKMKRKLSSIILRSVFSLSAVVVATCIGYMLFYGIPLWGLPEAEEIASVSVQDVRHSVSPVVITDRETIKKARKHANLTNYTLGTAAGGEALITVRYTLKNGEVRTLSANETTVWWQEKAYKMKDEALFVNTANIFFANAPAAD